MCTFDRKRAIVDAEQSTRLLWCALAAGRAVCTGDRLDRLQDSYCAAPSVAGLDAESVVGTHPGQELLFVLTGAVKVSFASQSVDLQTGDSVTFPGYVRHCIGRIGRRQAQVLIVVGGG